MIMQTYDHEKLPNVTFKIIDSKTWNKHQGCKKIQRNTQMKFQLLTWKYFDLHGMSEH